MIIFGSLVTYLCEHYYLGPAVSLAKTSLSQTNISAKSLLLIPDEQRRINALHYGKQTMYCRCFTFKTQSIVCLENARPPERLILTQ